MKLKNEEKKDVSIKRKIKENTNNEIIDYSKCPLENDDDDLAKLGKLAKNVVEGW